MKNSTQLIVLNHTKFGENSIVVHTLSRAYGRRGFLIRVGKKGAMSLFLPLNILEAEVHENPKANLWSATALTALDPLSGIRSNLYKNTMTLFMSEVLYRTVKDGEGDEADFYGTNAAVYAENGGQLTITDSRIETSGSHANAVFSYGEGSVINISDSVIETSKNNSGGIMVTGGGTLNAENLDVTTQGGSSAAIRSDRGGGTLNVNGGTYQSYGSGSPAI